MIVSQSIASAAVSYSMTKGLSTTQMSGDNRSCHDEEDLALNAEAEQKITEDSPHCCETDCHCPSGHCSSTALPVDIVPNARIAILSQNIDFYSQWIVGQSPSSLYRPPISL